MKLAGAMLLLAALVAAAPVAARPDRNAGAEPRDAADTPVEPGDKPPRERPGERPGGERGGMSKQACMTKVLNPAQKQACCQAHPDLCADPG